MDITVETQPDCTATLKATVSAADTASRRKAIVATYASRVKLPGFRPGKAPASTVEKRFNKEITAELSDSLFQDICSEALEKNPKLKVLDFGKPVESYEQDGAFTVTSSLTIVPDFTLPEYKGIEVTVPSEEVTEDDIEKAISDLANRLAEYNTVEKAAAEGDVTIIDFTTTLDGKPVAEALGKPAGFLEGREGQWMKVEEDGFIPGFSKGLEGTKAGDTKDIPVTLSDSFPFTELRNKEVVFHVTIKEVKEQVVPAIDEAFAERLMPGKSLEEVKVMLKEDLIKRKKNEIDNIKADQITEKLADALDFELPAALIERESYGITQQKMQELMYSGQVTTPEDMESRMESVREEATKDAKRNLKVYFMLQEIAREEKIDVTDQELTAEIFQQAQRSKQNPKTYIRQLRREGRIHGIRMSLLTAKVLDSLVKNATVKVSEDK